MQMIKQEPISSETDTQNKNKLFLIIILKVLKII